MASLIKCFKNAKSSHTASLTQDPVFKAPKTQTLSETWRVVYDGAVDALTAQNAAGLPIVGRTYYGGMFCTSVRPQLAGGESPFVWDVIVDYSTQQAQSTEDTNVWNVTINKSVAGRQEQVAFDRLGLPLNNTAGDLLPQLPTIDLYDDVYQISFTTDLDPSLLDDIVGKTNSDSFGFTICGITRSFTKSQAKCVNAAWRSTKIVNANDGTTETFRFTYDCELALQIRKPKWVWSAPNEGFNAYVSVEGDTDKKVLVRDPRNNPAGAPLTTPVPLLLSGNEKTSGAILKLPDDAIGGTTDHAGRTYVADGAFELEKQAAFGPFVTPLNDT